MEEINNWADEALEKLIKKMPVVATRNSGRIPYLTKDGLYEDMSEAGYCWWTNGFWGGVLWQMHNLTGDELYLREAKILEEKLDRNLMDPFGMDHDSGFKWLLTAVADYKITKDDKAFKRGLLAAENMAGRFNLAGGYIRAWNDNGDGSNAGTAIIDCMMNLPLLYWASSVTRDPRFSQIAKAHAQTTINNFIRPDYSVIHIGRFDSTTGEFLGSEGGQGMAEGSSWTRGQAWALYGFTMSYLHTRNNKYLGVACRIADRFIERIPENYHIPVDFDQPYECAWEDSSAAAIAACGLLKLSECVHYESEKKNYKNTGEMLLKTLYDELSNWDDSVDYIIDNCSVAYHDKEHNFPMVYGDYYFIEGLLRLKGKDIFLW
ncbi:MAG: glycoside hydrolase family 88 protein [Lachnospiraceae bacterium]|nr:glycoside hydrolase family 88 protein [Lachnospiraceae bacterium]